MKCIALLWKSQNDALQMDCGIGMQVMPDTIAHRGRCEDYVNKSNGGCRLIEIEIPDEE